MKKSYLFIVLFLQIMAVGISQNPLNCDFTVAPVACIDQEVKVTYTGGAPANATFLWNFDGATIISGTGQGPYFVRWTTIGEKHVTLAINFELQTCNATRPVVVMETPAVFHMTGGGVVVPGTAGVNVGLSGSQAGIIYKLRLNGQYTGDFVAGTGQAISFGLKSVPGTYTTVARVDGSDCMREMEGTAVVTLENPPLQQNICMVTFDTASAKNKIIWNKHPGNHLSHYNIFKETYQNNVFEKIGEVPYSSLSVYIDPVSDPLVKSDRYKISVSDSAGHESDRSLHHKTIHLNINPGIFGFNLIWNHYEGFDFLTYKIHRRHDAGTWQVIDSIAGNVDSYTDFYTEPGVTTYYIEVVRLAPCNPSLKENEVSSVISNTVAAAPLGVGDETGSAVLLYPNPVSDFLNLGIPAGEAFKVEISGTSGVNARELQVSGPGARINVSTLTPGLWFLRITGDQKSGVYKFVKN